MSDRHTFLFVDLVGFTALTAQEGDERAADVALELCERIRPLLADHSAEEIKAIGDALMLRGERPELAIDLGLCVVSTLEAVPGFPAVRVGMHTGPAVARAGDWFGTTVNVAARLCSAAAGGEVLVSDATRQAVGTARSFEVVERRLHWLKNVTEPVEVWVLSPPEPPPPRRKDSARCRILRLILPWRRRFESFPRLLQGACP